MLLTILCSASAIYLFFCWCRLSLFFCFFFFNDTATTEIYTLSLHDALPIYPRLTREMTANAARHRLCKRKHTACRSEEHTSELQSRLHLVCRLLLEKKKKKTHTNTVTHVISTTIK